MAAVNAAAAVQQLVHRIPAGAVVNGEVYENIDTPASVHVGRHSLWVIVSDDAGNRSFASFERQVVFATGANEQVLPVGAVPMEAAVMMVVARIALIRVLNLQPADINLAEAHLKPTAELPDEFHQAHEEAFVKAVRDYAGAATRYFALFYYNCLSLANCGHNHLPAANKKLASTTIVLAGLKDVFVEHPDWESLIMHDTFHPVSMGRKSQGARAVSAVAALNGVKFANIARRIPTKAPDCAIAMNYVQLVDSARQYPPSGHGIGAEFDAPANLAVHVAAYIDSDAATVQHAVMQLQADSKALTKVTCYVASYILGRLRKIQDEEDLDFKKAARTSNVTILGSPALQRIAGENHGVFSVAVREGGLDVTAAAEQAHRDGVRATCFQEMGDLPDIPPAAAAGGGGGGAGAAGAGAAAGGGGGAGPGGPGAAAGAAAGGGPNPPPPPAGGGGAVPPVPPAAAPVPPPAPAAAAGGGVAPAAAAAPGPQVPPAAAPNPAPAHGPAPNPNPAAPAGGAGAAP